MKPIHEDDPQPGFYKRRLVRGGPWVPAAIWVVEPERDEAGDLMSDEIWCCQVNGISVDVYDQWTWLAGHPITREEYDRLTDNDDAPPPFQALDLNATKPVF